MSKLVQCTHWLLTHCLGSRSGLQPHVSTDPPATTSSPPTLTPEIQCSTDHNTQTLCNIYVQTSWSSTSHFNRPSSNDLISADIDSETLCSTDHNTWTLCKIYAQTSWSSTSRFNRPSSSKLISADIDSGNSMIYRPSCRIYVQIQSNSGMLHYECVALCKDSEAERPILCQISSLVYPKIQWRQVIKKFFIQVS